MLWKPQKVEGWSLGREQVKGLFHFPSFKRLIQGMGIAHTGGLCWEGMTASKDGHSLGTGRCSGAPAEFPTNLCIWFLEWSRLLYLTPLFPYHSPFFKDQGLIPLVPKGHMLVREDHSELGEEPWEKGKGEYAEVWSIKPMLVFYWALIITEPFLKSCKLAVFIFHTCYVTLTKSVLFGYLRYTILFECYNLTSTPKQMFYLPFGRNE